MQRGQVSIYMLIGIIILAVFILAIFLMSQTNFMQNFFGSFESSVQSYVQDCLEMTTEDALYTMGVQGMYLSIPKQVFLETAPGSKTAMLLHDGATLVPTEEHVEEDLGKYIGLNLMQCLDGFGPYKDQYEIEADIPKIKVDVFPTSIIIETQFDMTMTKKGREGQTFVFSGFKYIKDKVRIPLLLQDITTIVHSVNATHAVDMTMLSDMEHDVDIVPHNSSTYIILLTDSFDDNPYSVRFATNFD